MAKGGCGSGVCCHCAFIGPQQSDSTDGATAIRGSRTRAIHQEHGAPCCPALAGAAVDTGAGTGDRVCVSLLWGLQTGTPSRTSSGAGASQAANPGGVASDQSSQNNSSSTPGSADQSPPETTAGECGSREWGGGHQLCYCHRLHFSLQLPAYLSPVHSSVPSPVPCPPVAAHAPHPSWHSLLEDLPMGTKEEAPKVPHPFG